MAEVVIQRWEESEHEPGWGTTVRPDGYSIHLSLEGCKKFRDEFWAQQRAALGEETPPIYQRASGEPEIVPVSPAKMRSVRTALGKRSGIWGREIVFRGVVTPRKAS